MKSGKLRILVLILALVSGCGVGNGGPGSSAPTLVSIAVTPANPSIALGTAEQFTATGTYSNNSTQNITTSVVWSSSTTTVATIGSNNGLAASVATGTTTITASSGSVSRSTTLIVTPAQLVSIVVTPAISSIATGSAEQFTAAGIYSDNFTGSITTPVTWTSSAPDVATVDSTGLAAAVSTAVTATTMITAKSGSASGSAILTVTGSGSTTAAVNVLPITVNGPLCSAVTSSNYLNKPCVSVTVCTHNTSTCQTIDDILLDTGSFGLRIFKQALNVPLTQATSGSGLLAECLLFGDGSSVWGPVQIADVILGNEKAQNVPIQVIDSTFGTSSIASICGTPDQSPTVAGYTGILGVGVFIQDCGPGCAPPNSNNGIYYSCTGGSCTGVAVALADQAQNPVALLTADNNGVIVELPSVPSAGSPSVDGILVLGIGTQTNNMPSGVTTYHTDQFGDIVTIFDGISYTSSIIDSGSNGLFFTAPSASLLPTCAVDWFCPPSTTTLSATNTGASGSPSGGVLFQIGNFTSLTSSSNNVFSDIGGPGAPNQFDWGLPFHFGRSVIVGIEGKTSSIGTGPYFAY